MGHQAVEQHAGSQEIAAFCEGSNDVQNIFTTKEVKAKAIIIAGLSNWPKTLPQSS
jgi:hypothetical protein